MKHISRFLANENDNEILEQIREKTKIKKLPKIIKDDKERRYSKCKPLKKEKHT